MCLREKNVRKNSNSFKSPVLVLRIIQGFPDKFIDNLYITFFAFVKRFFKAIALNIYRKIWAVFDWK